MKIINEEINPQITQLNETLVNAQDSLPDNIERSIYYTKLKVLLHSEIMNFCKEQTELKNDLNTIRMSVGQMIPYSEIKDIFDGLMEKYNGKYQNVGLVYHSEATRIDIAVALVVTIKRSDIYMKKFVFRFRKNIGEDINDMNINQLPKPKRGGR